MAAATDGRIHRIDLVPRAVDAGILEAVADFASRNETSDDVVAYLATLADPEHVTWEQLLQIIADAQLAGLPGAHEIVVDGDALPAGIPRPVAVGGPGMSKETGNVWFGSYEGQTWNPDAKIGPLHNTGTFRFYRNGVLKTTLTDYNVTDMTTLGAHAGDIIQVCQEKDGVVGWWARIAAL